MNTMTRFLDKIDRSGECWEWTAQIAMNGYGVFFLNGIQTGAHRAAYRLLVGEIPNGLYVLHHCDNRSCVNPDHLFLGTQSDNLQDAAAKGRMVSPALAGEENGRAKLTQNDVNAIRELYATGELVQRELGERYGVGTTTIGAVITGQNWNRRMDTG